MIAWVYNDRNDFLVEMSPLSHVRPIGTGFFFLFYASLCEESALQKKVWWHFRLPAHQSISNIQKMQMINFIFFSDKKKHLHLEGEKISFPIKSQSCFDTIQIQIALHYYSNSVTANSWIKLNELWNKPSNTFFQTYLLYFLMFRLTASTENDIMSTAATMESAVLSAKWMLCRQNTDEEIFIFDQQMKD